MTSVSNVEREVKLAMEVRADLPDLRGVVGTSVRQPEQSLRADYYDTARHEIVAARYHPAAADLKMNFAEPAATAGT